MLSFYFTVTITDIRTSIEIVMAKYREYKGLNLPNIDQEILNKWVAENTFSKSIEERSKDNSFVFYEGPPSANGKPGIHLFNIS